MEETKTTRAPEKSQTIAPTADDHSRDQRRDGGQRGRNIMHEKNMADGAIECIAATDSGDDVITRSHPRPFLDWGHEQQAGRHAPRTPRTFGKQPAVAENRQKFDTYEEHSSCKLLAPVFHCCVLIFIFYLTCNYSIKHLTSNSLNAIILTLCVFLRQRLRPH